MIAVTGVTGFIGSHLLRRLLSSRRHVRVLVRSKAAFLRNRNTDSQLKTSDIVEGDLLDSESTDQLCHGAEMIIHCAGIVQAKRKSDVSLINRFGTAQILEAAKKQGVPHFIYVSSGGVDFLDDRYAASKRDAEDCVKAYSGNWLIIRPSEIYGPGDRAGITKLIRVVKSWPVLPIIGDGRYTLQPLFITDLIDAMTRASEKIDVLSGKTLTVAGPEPLSFLECISEIECGVNRRIPRLHIPEKAALAVARLLEFSGIPSPTDPEQIRRVLTSKFWNIEEATRCLDFQPRTFRNGIRESISVFVSEENNPGRLR